MGEYEEPDGVEYKVSVTVNPKEKTHPVSDNGLGMTADEVEEYINQIAFSGAQDFLNKYKDKANEDQIIGHFGLGFYSAFMVADRVTIDTLSYKADARAVHWESEGGTEYEMTDGDKTEAGTTITLYLNDDSTEFANEYRAREVLEKYCAFMPVEIYVADETAEPQYDTIEKDELTDKDTVIETIVEEAKTEEKENEDGTKETVEVSPAREKYKILRRPEPINDTPSPVEQASQRVHRGGIQGILPQGIHGLQGALILDPPEHGLPLQLKGDPVLPQDQYGVREHRGKDQAV